MNIRQIGRVSSGLTLGGLMLLASACGSKSSGSSDKVTISGTLQDTSTELQANEVGGIKTQGLENFGVRCVTLSGEAKSGEGAANSAGAFSLDLTSATNVPIGCFVITGSGDSAKIVAVVSFETSTTGLDNQKTREGSYVAGSGSTGLAFGTVSLNVKTGQATIDKSKVTVAGGVAGTIAGTLDDLTGNWKIKKPTNKPSGYAEVCAVGTRDCDGPAADQVVHFREYTATDGTNDHKGFSIWESEAAFTACAGTNGGEDAQLPSGWSAKAGSEALTRHLNGLSTSFPSPIDAKVQAAQGNPGQKICNTSAAVGDSCSTVTAGWGLSTPQCVFYCSLMSNFNQEADDAATCTAEMQVDWQNFSTGLASVTPAYTSGSWATSLGGAATSNPDYVGYIANGHGGYVIQFRREPKARFMFNELVVSGAVGTLNDHREHTYSACSTKGTGGCTDTVQCKSYENNRFTITQTETGKATVELVQTSTSDSTNAAACDEVHDNDSNKDAKFFFNVEKQ